MIFLINAPMPCIHPFQSCFPILWFACHGISKGLSATSGGCAVIHAGRFCFSTRGSYSPSRYDFFALSFSTHNLIIHRSICRYFFGQSGKLVCRNSMLSKLLKFQRPVSALRENKDFPGISSLRSGIPVPLCFSYFYPLICCI